MSLAATLTEEDRAVWASYARLVVPLRGQPVPRADPEPVVQPAPAPARSPSATASRPIPSPPRPLDIGTHPAGVDGSTWNRFRTGRLPPARTLDLHGHTVQRAFHALEAFLRSALAEHLRCVEIITGRGGAGGGAIRREFPLWINRPEFRSLLSLPRRIPTLPMTARSVCSSGATAPGQIDRQIDRKNSISSLFTAAGCSCCTQCPAPSIRWHPSICVQTLCCILSTAPGR